ncbi:transporter substrate-binding domain-containing protein [Clostridium swellfunianum]|uniref:transporter substrate-binding domain-containing protein n=1 Tax=Clostridium swellfunianum TaxID=1367462 RepID=UPI0020305372|nr:transporter substrate-binding domain-containing protein [Clostridium swellfunianum]MCM0649901.1 transporter substrate-binding domain-containing protein [Clostridium swellfunianum]
MKKILLLTLTAIVAASVMTGCDQKTTTTVNTKVAAEDVIASVKKNDTLASALPEKTKTAGKISFGVDDAYPPMEYRDEKNTLVGFDIDFGNAIAKKLGIKSEWVPTVWDGILPSLSAKKFDAILSSLSITDKRKLEIGFSEPYIMGGPIIITKKDNTSIKTSDDLKGKIVGVQLGSTGDNAVSVISGTKEIKKYDKIPQALLDLTSGRIEAVVADDQVGRYYVGLDASKYLVAGKLNDEPFGIGFRKEDKDLTDVVQKAIDDLKADGTLSKISLKWFKTDIYKK